MRHETRGVGRDARHETRGGRVSCLASVLDLVCIVPSALAGGSEIVCRRRVPPGCDPSVMSEAYWRTWNGEALRKIDADIERNRKADACFRLDGVAVGTTVRVEQVSHAYRASPSSSTEQFITFAERHGMIVHGHPLVWGSEEWMIPFWLYEDFCPEDETAFLRFPKVDPASRTRLFAGKEWLDVYRARIGMVGCQFHLFDDRLFDGLVQGERYGSYVAKPDRIEQLFASLGSLGCPVYHALYDLIHREWRTTVSAVVSPNGAVSFRGFRGKYRLSWADPTGRPLSCEYCLK